MARATTADLGQRLGALLEAREFDDLPGKWQAAIPWV
jgi:hypothetical protein